MVLPRIVSHYEVQEVIGQGGMGEVCRAVDLRLGRTVAIKFQAEDLMDRPDLRERFLNEGRALSSLSHPNIATIHEADDAGGRPFLVMEYLPGGTLKERVRAKAQAGEKAELAQVTGWCLALAKALDCAHRHGVLHRDIKTSNAMFDAEGRLKLTDFGLARTSGAETTQSSTISGTFAYMAPELLMGSPPSERTDLYSLGMTFYEVAAGGLPFAGDSQASLIARILHEPPLDLAELRPDLPGPLLQLVRQLLSKQPGERPGSAREVVEALQAVAHAADADVTLTVPRQILRQPAFRKRVLHTVLAAAALAAIGIGVTALREPVTQLLQRADLPARRYIAVLPFQSIGGDDAQQALCDGLMETLATALSRRTRMQVAPPTEVRELKSAEQARRELGVNLVLAGSLQKRPSGMRLTLRLVDAATRRQIDAREIDSGPNDAPQMEDAILLHVADMLDTAFEPPASPIYAGAAMAPGAWDTYLRGRGFVFRFDKEGNLGRAVQSFDEAIRREPKLAHAWSGKAEALLLLYRQRKDPGLLEEARLTAGKALQLDPGLAEARVLLGAALAEGRFYDQAEKELQTARITAPSDAAAYRELAALYRARGFDDRAEAVYRQAAAARPEDWRGYNSLGVFFSRQGRFEEAVDQFLKVVELTPDNHIGYRNLGGAYMQLRRYRESEQASKKAAAMRPSATAWSNLGALYLMQHRYQDAVRAQEEAWKLMPRENPREYRIPGNLGEAYRFSNAPAGRAQWAYRQAIQIAEKQLTGTAADAMLHSSLGLYHAGAGDTAEAVDHIERALESRGKDAEIRYRAAVVYSETGNLPRAMAEVRAALELGYSLALIQDAPLLAPLRSDPEFKKLAAQYKSKD